MNEGEERGAASGLGRIVLDMYDMWPGVWKALGGVNKAGEMCILCANTEQRLSHNNTYISGSTWQERPKWEHDTMISYIGDALQPYYLS